MRTPIILRSFCFVEVLVVVLWLLWLKLFILGLVVANNSLSDPPIHTNSMSAISQLLLTRFWPNFKGRLLGTYTTDSNCFGGYLSRQYLSYRHLSISGISQLLLTKFRPNFKGTFLGPSLTDANRHSDICPVNIICHGNICPYQQYLSCYWPDFDQTLTVGS